MPTGTEFLLIFCLLIAAGALAISRIGRSPADPPREADAARRRRAAPAAAEAAAEPARAAATPAAPVAAPAAAAPEAAAAAAPGPPAGAERRRHTRLPMDRTFTVYPFAGEAVLAVCHDVSLGGMRFGLVGATLREGDLVRVSFNVGEETVAAVGRVLRVRHPDPITSDVSLAFERLDPWAARLIEEALAAGD